ncbi:MAG: hypothetical protein AB1485_07935 [Candidatus Thermoplasmatota archaeon]
MKKEEKEHAKIHGIIQALREFVKTLVDMERKGEVERIGHGEITGLWYHAKYGYRARIGIEREDFSRPYKKFRNSKGKLKIEKESIKVIDKGGTVTVLAKLPSIKEENIKVETTGKALKLVANIEQSKIKRSIPIKELGIQKASFKNGILELELDKNIISEE